MSVFKWLVLNDTRLRSTQINAQQTSRTVGNIICDNILTLFNIMLALVALVIITTMLPIGNFAEKRSGTLTDLLFMIIIIVNAGIGIATELKAKRVLDKLSLLIKQKYKVQRDGQSFEVYSDEIIKDDLITLQAGSQIPTDARIENGSVEVNEAMLTGESINIAKTAGDVLMSGTSVVVGECLAKVLTSSADSYAAKLTVSAKQFKLASSDLRNGINKILKYISFGIVPVAILLILKHIFEIGGFEVAFSSGTWRTAVLHAAAGIIGMIPEGLVLLTSLNFAIAAILLSQKNILVTELNSVETLARVDELILDKTGTITDGTVEVEQIIHFGDEMQTLSALKALCELPGGTTTSEAICAYLRDIKATEYEKFAAFDSAKKYTSIQIGTTEYKMGAPDIIAKTTDISEYTKNGTRIIACTENEHVVALILCRERIRPGAKDIISYFISSGVNVRVVSGDNEATVRNIAKKVGILEVIGRAKPETKLEIVRDLQKQGKVVAMTGDGVNDMLALKEADLGIAMGNAAPASKAVANLVLIDSDFGQLPSVIKQGRRVIANIERVASLFLVKTFYSIGLAFATLFLLNSYPFLPRHLTIVSSLTIGIPAFFLALAPNNTPYHKGFLKRVIFFSLPFGVLATILIVAVNYIFGTAYGNLPSLIALLVVSFTVLAFKSRPLLSWRGLMFLALLAFAVLGFFIPIVYQFFGLR